MYNFICENCGKEFQAKYKNRKYCSRKCACNEMSKNNIKKYSDIIGKRFGKLVVLERDSRDKRHPHLICNCDCGSQISVNIEHLLARRTNSCGCLRIEKTFVEDTSLNTIRSKVRSDNISGVKGVTWYKPTKKWVAYITFQKKSYFLGYHVDIEAAIKARKEAENNLFKPMLEKYPDVKQKYRFEL